MNTTMLKIALTTIAALTMVSANTVSAAEITYKLVRVTGHKTTYSDPSPGKPWYHRIYRDSGIVKVGSRVIGTYTKESVYGSYARMLTAETTISFTCCGAVMATIQSNWDYSKGIWRGAVSASNVASFVDSRTSTSANNELTITY